jgi:hypothetical protein
VEILQQFEARGLIKAMVHAEPRGKAACISDALATAKGEIVFFADVRQQIEPPALRFWLKILSILRWAVSAEN